MLDGERKPYPNLPAAASESSAPLVWTVSSASPIRALGIEARVILTGAWREADVSTGRIVSFISLGLFLEDPRRCGASIFYLLERAATLIKSPPSISHSVVKCCAFEFGVLNMEH